MKSAFAPNGRTGTHHEIGFRARVRKGLAVLS
jgi:hypothetical protein